MNTEYSVRSEGRGFGIYRETKLESNEIQSERVDGGYRTRQCAEDMVRAYGWILKQIKFNQ